MTTHPARPLLTVRHLTKSFAGIKAVDDLSFEVPRGSIFGLIGPNGSGKSTTIDCITGFTTATAGEVQLGDSNLSGCKPEVIAQRGLTRTFQNVRVYDRLTLLENTMIARQSFDRVSWLSAFLKRSPAREADEAARQRGCELIALVGLERMIDFPAGFLSYGQKKLLALAMTLMSSPQLIILDEPLAGVNPTVVKRVAELIAELNRAGQTFIVVEHNVQFIMKHCHRVLVMEQGRKLVEGGPLLIRQDPRVLSAYLGKADDIARELAFHD